MLFADSDMQFSRCLTGISIEVGDASADMILEMCIKKLVTIRKFSFAKNILEMHTQHKIWLRKGNSITKNTSVICMCNYVCKCITC